jgi:hypothetical protein
MIIGKALSLLGVLSVLAATPDAFAQTLDDCPKTQDVPWTNCKGVRTYPDGSIYTGDFQDDRRHGKGVLSGNGGVSYVGEFVRDAFEGAGILWMPGGMIYVGEFREGRINGTGVMKTSETDRHIGEFKDGVLTKSAEFPLKEKRIPASASVATGEGARDAEHISGFKIDPTSLAFLLCFAAFLIDIVISPPACRAPGAGRRLEWPALVLLIFFGGVSLAATISSLAGPVGAYIVQHLENKEPAAARAPIQAKGRPMTRM